MINEILIYIIRSISYLITLWLIIDTRIWLIILIILTYYSIITLPVIIILSIINILINRLLLLLRPIEHIITYHYHWTYWLLIAYPSIIMIRTLALYFISMVPVPWINWNHMVWAIWSFEIWAHFVLTLAVHCKFYKLIQQLWRIIIIKLTNHI